MKLLKIGPDELWVAALEDFTFEAIICLMGKWAEENIDFDQPPTFFDKELRNLSPVASKRKRQVDKLIKVYLKSGQEHWFLLHVEVQGYKDLNFEERMFIYYTRIKERWYPHEVSCIALYTDGPSSHHPDTYRHAFAGTEVTFKFNTFKLWEKTSASLFIENNAFSLLLLAAQKAIDRANQTDSSQIEWKISLIKSLLGMQVAKEKIDKALTFISYIVNFQNKDSVINYNQRVDKLFKQNTKDMGFDELIEKKTQEAIAREVKKAVKKARTAFINEYKAALAKEREAILAKEREATLAKEREAALLDEIAALKKRLGEQ